MKEDKIEVGEIKGGFRILDIPKAKTRMKVGKERSVIIELDIKFNKLQKFMWKKFFNVKVEDVED